jgi:hypothetical protein
METLKDSQISNLIEKHKKTIQEVSEYDLSVRSEFEQHCILIERIGDNYLGREFRTLEFDRNNGDIFRFLVYYFNNRKEAEDIFPDKEYKIHKNLLLVGNAGTGKTLIMQIFADYLKLTGNPNIFKNVSVTQMMNYYKINGHIDQYTYNELSGRGAIEGNPVNICINDIGLETENQKSYGTSLDSVIDEFLYARYEIYQSHFKKYHITSNLTIDEFKGRFGSRLVDRFKSFNVISLLGDSRRK